MSWQATVLTIFPEMLPGPLAYSLAGKALAAGIWRLETVDIRDFAGDKHRSVDDAPFGDPTVCIQGDRVIHLVFPVIPQSSKGRA